MTKRWSEIPVTVREKHDNIRRRDHLWAAPRGFGDCNMRCENKKCRETVALTSRCVSTHYGGNLRFPRAMIIVQWGIRVGGCWQQLATLSITSRTKQKGTLHLRAFGYLTRITVTPAVHPRFFELHRFPAQKSVCEHQSSECHIHVSFGLFEHSDLS